MSFLKNLFGKKEEKKPPRDPRIDDLRLGDVLLHFDDSYVVEQIITYHENGFFWYDYRLEDGSGEQLWLSVEDDDELIVGLYKPVDVTLTEAPGKTFEVAGELFTLVEKGKADAHIKRQNSESKSKVTHWDFQSGEKLLSISQWGEGDFDLSVGRQVNPVELDLLPGAEL